MKIEIVNGQRVEYADDGKWLHDDAPDWERVFSKLVYLGKDAKPWAECTTAEKEAWEAEHPQSEPPEPEEE